MRVSLKTLTFNKILTKAPIVSLDGQPVLLFNQQHPSLLVALEHKQVKVFSECRNGYCGACKTKINSGSVKYHTLPLIELESDECLPCCCTPTSDLDLNLSPEGADVVTRPGITTAVFALEQTKS
ncbi:2Fe-2S iron-sulfur cluster binding domain-containing protein [Shewanella eurypsychrophilus]|uniref:2Fe-2S iron-sulfur cluster binding domain-containing protein n=1 Tax=Shewanella eurypsychrophilus TaxID=2593656 RepID=A0ABX6VCN5_9GAMM|nr:MULTISPECIES: class I ribonucleotide reductase maintenance protein YfaE [Shewanella]QFU25319.1 2Fe-2S iron-sulfur cluster binding domain-containing protein [Shewanella sp. YLB-09]QPG60465.1 2Fe-2S iron-sulfur cluster binding domain-containing protein [Shewanella eurypsychrophilus]